MEHIFGAGGDIPDDLAEGKEYADILEAELKARDIRCWKQWSRLVWRQIIWKNWRKRQ